MLLKNSISLINEFFSLSLQQIRKIYLNSNIYNKKISINENNTLNYKPSLSILSCLIKYEKKKNKIEDIYISEIWEKKINYKPSLSILSCLIKYEKKKNKIENFYISEIWEKKINYKDLKKLHSFYWLFTIDLKSSKKITHSIIQNWIEKNQNYNYDIWEIDILSKRIISWISNSQLTYEDTSEEYKIIFNNTIMKQANHLINEINRSELVDNKMLGCTAIILFGLSYNDKKILNYGLNLLNKINKYSFDTEGFPKSRSLRELIFYLKHLKCILVLYF